MDISLRKKGRTLIVGLKGEMDHHNVQSVRTCVDDEIVKAGIKNILFDFHNVEFMDSSGIGTLVGRYNNIKRLGGKAAIAGPKGSIKRVLKLSGLHRIMPIYENVEKALTGMNR